MKGAHPHLKIFGQEMAHNASTHIPLTSTQYHGHILLKFEKCSLAACQQRKKNRFWKTSRILKMIVEGKKRP